MLELKRVRDARKLGVIINSLAKLGGLADLMKVRYREKDRVKYFN